MGLMEDENTTYVAKDDDDISTTELGQESCVKKKKKPRRVSFAEITSVHVFDRDEDYETPPDNKPNTGEDRVRTLPGGSPRPSLKLLQNEDVDDHLQSTPMPGLQENESEKFFHEADTPGSISDRGTPGEEGEFFGPVSLWHIAPGMSARSPVTDDITLDCTTFSLQFGKLMVPDKECVNPMEEVKTPAMEIEGRTPATADFKTPAGQTGQPSLGNSMVLTKPKQPVSRRLVSDDDTLGNVEGMDDMRMTDENQFKFDFANMHPDLDSLLAQKISELQPTISSKERNQGWKLSGSSHPQQKLADALTKRGRDTESKDIANVEVDGEGMILIDESQFKCDFESMPLDIDSLLAQKVSGSQPTITSKEQNQGWQLSGSSYSEQKLADALMKRGRDMESKEFSDIEVKRLTTETGSTKNIEDNLSPDEANQSTIEIVSKNDSNINGTLPTKNNEGIKLIPDEEANQTMIEIMSENGKGTSETKNYEHTELTPMKRSTIGTLSTKNSEDGKLMPNEEVKQFSIEIVSENDENTIRTLSTDNNEDSKLTPDEEVNRSIVEIVSKNGKNTAGSWSARDQKDTKSRPDEEVCHSTVGNRFENGEITIRTLSTKNNEDNDLTPDEVVNQSTIEIASNNGEKIIGTLSTNNNEGTKLTPVKRSTVGTLTTKIFKDTGLMPDEDMVQSTIEIVSKNGENTVGILSTKKSRDTKLIPDKEVNQSTIEVASKNGKNTIGTFSIKTDEDTKLTPYGEMNLYTSKIVSGIDKNNLGTLLFKDNEDVKLTQDEEVKQQQRQLGIDSLGWKTELKGYVDEEVNGPSTEIVSTRHYNNTKATPHIEIRQSTIESASAKQIKDTKVMSVDDPSFIQFEKQQQKQKGKFWAAEGGIEPKDPVIVELRESMSEIMSDNNCSKGKLRTDPEFMAKHSYGLIESSLEHDVYSSSHAESENQGNIKGQNQKEYFFVQRMNVDGIGKEGTGKNPFSNTYEDSVGRQSGSVEFQERHACYTPLQAAHSVAKQSGLGKLQEVRAHFTPTKTEGSVVEQSGSVELQEIRTCYTPLEAVHSIAKQSGSEKLQEMHAYFTPTKAESSAVKQSGRAKLYTHSNTRAMNAEEASCLVPPDMKTKINHGNNVLPVSQREWSSTHENITDWQSYQKHQISAGSTDHVPKELKISQHPTVGNCLKTIEFLHVPQKILSTPVFDGKGSHGKKRKSEEMEVHEKGNLIETSWNNSSICERKPVEPVFIGNEYVDHLKGPMHSIKKSSVAKNHPAQYVMATSPTKLSNAPVKFFQGCEDLCLPLITKPTTLQECLSFIFLQRPQLCLLQDTLKQLQENTDMMKNLDNQQFQAMDGKKHLEVGNKLIHPNHESLGHCKWLRQVLAYERSKLLLLQTKKDELMKKFQELHSGCKEVDRLKCIYAQKQVVFNTRSGRPVIKARSGAEAEAYIQSLEAEIGKQVDFFSNKKLLMEGKLKGIERENQRAQERVINTEHQLGILDKKIQNMCEFYCGFLKVECNMRKGEIAELLRNHVKKRSQATCILQDMQLWKLKEMKSKLGEHIIELSYSNTVSQRFVSERDGQDANIWTCLSLNHETIEKVFPFMNASAVFGFVLGSKESCKIQGAGNICQVIQETSFLYGTLIDVLEEVQACRSTLLNLSFTHFDCIGGCGLQLKLKFISDTMGLEARVVLDMSSLLCGVYPSDAFPLEVKIEQFGSQPKCLLMVEEVDKEIRALQPGYRRIKNLCDCVSRLLERNG